MNTLMLFEEHKVEILEIDGQILFNPYDVGNCLDLTENGVKTAITKMNDTQVIKLTNSKVAKYNFRKLHNTGENFLTESGVYKLVFKSHKPDAEKFTDWIADEVLPSIRKTGAYKTNQDTTNHLESIEAINEAANIIIPIVEAVGMEPIHKSYLLRQLYDKAGIEIPMIRVEQDAKLFDKTMIAEQLGVYSANEKPHAQAIGAIIKKLDIDNSNIVLTAFTKQGHTGTDYQYKAIVLQQVRKWLEDNNYPNKINDDNKIYKVSYIKVNALV